MNIYDEVVATYKNAKERSEKNINNIVQKEIKELLRNRLDELLNSSPTAQDIIDLFSKLKIKL